MLLHEMAYVYEVYRQRSFTRAAQALYISQPSLSQMIHKAEMRIGAPIFDRSTSPTSAPPNRCFKSSRISDSIWTMRNAV